MTEDGGGVRSFVRSYPPSTALREALREHQAHVGLAVGLFAAGVVLGAVLYLAGVNLIELFIELLEDELLADIEEGDIELTPQFFIVHNTQPFLLAIGGALTVGILTAWIMVFNGVIVGNISAFMTDEIGPDYVFVGLAPHGIFELPALFLAAAVGFRIVHRFGQRVLGSRDAFVTRRYLYRTAILVVAAWLLLVVAAFVEAWVTPVLLESLFDADAIADDLEGTVE